MSKQPRILYSFPDRLDRSGDSLNVIAWHQIDGLAALGVNVVVYCSSLRTPFTHPVEIHQTLGWGKVRVPHRLVGVDRAHAIHDAKVARVLAIHSECFDAVHCWPSAALKTLEAAKAADVKSFLERPNTHTRSAQEIVARECERIGLSLPNSHSHSRDEERLATEEAEFALADWLLCPSEHVAESFRERGFAPERIARHRYGCDLSRFVPGRSAEKARPFSACFVGRCEPRKGLHHALQAWRDSGAGTRGTLTICGRFVPGYRENLGALMNQPGVNYLGHCDNVQAVMRDSDVLLLPSLEEGSALVTYEARASGCVLMVSSACGAPCENEINALIHPPGDVGVLTEHLRQLSTDPSSLLALRNESLATREDVSWDTAASALLRAYRRAIDNPVAACVEKRTSRLCKEREIVCN